VGSGFSFVGGSGGRRPSARPDLSLSGASSWLFEHRHNRGGGQNSISVTHKLCQQLLPTVLKNLFRIALEEQPVHPRPIYCRRRRF